MTRKLSLLVFLFLLASLPTTAAQQSGDNIALAYVWNNVVTLADYQGNPLIQPGPQLEQWQSARLFWSPDGNTLYIATRDGLFVTGAQGGAAVRLPGEFGLTVVMARHGGVLYNLDAASPQPIDDNTAAFPLRETNLAVAEGGLGKLISTIGAYRTDTVNVNVTHAAALYARDSGLLEAGRPQLWPTYGGSMFYSCCFPDPGLGLIDVAQNNPAVYDRTFMAGAAAQNSSMSRLAGPTTEGLIRVIDLITAGTRDYVVDMATVPIERVAWAADDSAIFFVSREPPTNPLELLPEVGYLADTRSANIILWKLDLVTGHTSEVVSFGDVFGVSSMAVTGDFVFVITVERNELLVNALNTGQLDPNVALTDPALDAYVPRTILWRIEPTAGQMFAVDENVWGVAARPR